MTDNNDEQVIAQAEKIARMAMGGINLEEYEALLFRAGSMLAVWRAAMVRSGYSEYFVELCAWMMMTSFYGHHLTETRIEFAPHPEIYQASEGPIRQERYDEPQGGSTESQQATTGEEPPLQQG